jgi:hypothetical protein
VQAEVRNTDASAGLKKKKLGPEWRSLGSRDRDHGRMKTVFENHRIASIKSISFLKITSFKIFISNICQCYIIVAKKYFYCFVLVVVG